MKDKPCSILCAPPTRPLQSAVSAALAAQLPGMRGWSVVSPSR